MCLVRVNIERAFLDSSYLSECIFKHQTGQRWCVIVQPCLHDSAASRWIIERNLLTLVGCEGKVHLLKHCVVNSTSSVEVSDFTWIYPFSAMLYLINRKVLCLYSTQLNTYFADADFINNMRHFGKDIKKEVCSFFELWPLTKTFRCLWETLPL